MSRRRPVSRVRKLKAVVQGGVDGTNPKDAIASCKPPIGLVPSGLLVPLARVMELGAKKYGFWNWRLTRVRYSVYVHAALRHLLSSLDGEEIDPESGQPHIAHAAACCAILLDAKAVGTLVDDRSAGAAARLIVESTTSKAPKGRKDGKVRQ